MSPLGFVASLGALALAGIVVFLILMIWDESRHARMREHQRVSARMRPRGRPVEKLPAAHLVKLRTLISFHQLRAADGTPYEQAVAESRGMRDAQRAAFVAERAEKLDEIGRAYIPAQLYPVVADLAVVDALAGRVRLPHDERATIRARAILDVRRAQLFVTRIPYPDLEKYADVMIEIDSSRAFSSTPERRQAVLDIVRAMVRRGITWGDCSPDLVSARSRDAVAGALIAMWENREAYARWWDPGPATAERPGRARQPGRAGQPQPGGR